MSEEENHPNDFIVIHDDEIIVDVSESSSVAICQPVWNVLIVDDDEQVHASTRFAIGDLEIVGRRLNFLHAYSAAQAKQVLTDIRSIAVILLDVVMETDSSGLELIEFIRDELQNHSLRIILRTGQPGYAPELEVISNYDINDYRTKSELTRTRLITTITSAIRSYKQISTIESSKQRLSDIVHSITSILEHRTLEAFGVETLKRFAGFLGVSTDGMLCLRQEEGYEPMIIAATGELKALINGSPRFFSDKSMMDSINRALESKTHQFDRHTCIYISSSSCEGVLYFSEQCVLSEIENQLLQILMANVSMGLTNVHLLTRLNDMAYTDELCRIPNRNACLAYLSEQIQRRKRDWQLFLIDIHQFTDINDGLGQRVGNMLLQEVALRVEHGNRGFILTSRVAADVFAVVAKDTVTPDMVLALFDEPVYVAGNQLKIVVRIGICPSTIEVEDGLAVLNYANIALNRAKANPHLMWTSYEQSMLENTTERIRIVNELKQALASKQLELWYQPQLALDTMEVIGVEALLRWRQSGSYVSPAIFIPLAEYSGLIVDIGAWVLRQAAETLSRLQKRYDLRMAVNVSMPQFRQPNFVEQVERIIMESGVSTQLLELEITESIAMEDPNLVRDKLVELQKIGVSVAIDDFGTGYSSLSYLQTLAIDRLKIDRAFVVDIDHGKNGVIAEMILTLGKRLNLTVVAEGVETLAQEVFLKEHNCDYVQGFKYAKPMPADELDTWLQTQKVAIK